MAKAQAGKRTTARRTSRSAAPSPLDNGRRFLTFRETMEFLNVRKTWLQDAMHHRRIPFLKFNRLVYFAMDDLQNFVASVRVPAEKNK